MSKATSVHLNPALQKLIVIMGALFLSFAIGSTFKTLSSKGGLLTHSADNKGKGSILPQKAFSKPFALLTALDAHCPARGWYKFFNPALHDNLKSLPVYLKIQTCKMQLLLRLLNSTAVRSKCWQPESSESWGYFDISIWELSHWNLLFIICLERIRVKLKAIQTWWVPRNYHCFSKALLGAQLL